MSGNGADLLTGPFSRGPRAPRETRVHYVVHLLPGRDTSEIIVGLEGLLMERKYYMRKKIPRSELLETRDVTYLTPNDQPKLDMRVWINPDTLFSFCGGLGLSKVHINPIRSSSAA